MSHSDIRSYLTNRENWLLLFLLGTTALSGFLLASFVQVFPYTIGLFLLVVLTILLVFLTIALQETIFRTFSFRISQYRARSLFVFLLASTAVSPYLWVLVSSSGVARFVAVVYTGFLSGALLVLITVHLKAASRNREYS